MSETTKFQKTTEANSTYANLDKMKVHELLTAINTEDKTVPKAIKKAIPTIEKVVKRAVKQVKKGGRIFYIGAGTSGRLGIVDASECPPTFGVSPNMVIGIIAGGDTAIRTPVEHAEDDTKQGWLDLKKHQVSPLDFVIGIAASGTTPYVVGAVNKCKERGIYTACITCNADSDLAKAVDLPIEVVVGPEFLTASTRMKAGSAQKLVLNMISTALMIKLGRVKGNKMVDMKMTNAKLIERGTQMLMEEMGIDHDSAHELLIKQGSVRKALVFKIT